MREIVLILIIIAVFICGYIVGYMDWKEETDGGGE